MAGLLNTVYLVVATLVAVAGMVFVASTMNDSDPDGPSLVDWSLMLVGAVFLVALAAGFMT